MSICEVGPRAPVFESLTDNQRSIPPRELGTRAVVDAMPAPERQKSNLKRRHDAITHMVTLFPPDDPRIHRFVAQYAKPELAMHPTSSTAAHRTTTRTYSIPSNDQFRELFGYIDTGVALYEQGIDLNNLTEQETEIVSRLAAARQALVLTNLGLVSQPARAYCERLAIPEELYPDVVQNGINGLIDGINRFDISKGNALSTYVNPWIEAKIRKTHREEIRDVYLPKAVYHKVGKLDHVQRELAAALGRPATSAEIADKLAITPSEAEELRRLNRHALPLDMPIDDDGTPLGNYIPDDENRQTDTVALEQLRPNAVKRVATIADISDRDLLILGLLYEISPEVMTQIRPLDNVAVKHNSNSITSYAEAFRALCNETTDTVTANAIARFLGVTRQGINQAETKALAKLREVAAHTSVDELSY